MMRLSEYVEKIIDVFQINSHIVLLTAIFISFSIYFICRKKFALSLIHLVFGFLSIFYLNGLINWITGLGGDSFFELNSIDKSELIEFIKSFIILIPKTQSNFDKSFFVISLGVIILSALFCFLLHLTDKFRYVMSALIVIYIIKSIYIGYIGFYAGQEYVAELERQFSGEPKNFGPANKADLFIYIGESTTRLNMSLYGYPLPTTPRLEAISKNDVGFLKFDNVRSTHSHTSPSLLRALSLTEPGADGRQAQYGIGKILQRSGAAPILFSTQPMSGSFASFSKFVFDGARFQRPTADKYLGNLSAPRHKDRYTLDKSLKSGGVVFFHSYAGHGGYVDNIDRSMSNKVTHPNISFSGIFGKDFSELTQSYIKKDLDDYNQSLTYIDRNVSHAIEMIKNRKNAAAFIYFSDHGEAVYTKRGHESSQYIDEMTSVPLIIYFNQAYRQKFPIIFDKYQKASKSDTIRLLDQVTPTILDILSIDKRHQIAVPTFSENRLHPNPFIMARQTISGKSQIDVLYDKHRGFRNRNFFGGSADATYLSIIKSVVNNDNTICYHRSNTYAKALRGAAVADCLEFDLVVSKSKLNIYHPPEQATGFQLHHIFDIAEPRKTSLWIDAKNIYDEGACGVVADYLENNHKRVGQIFVEFPSSLNFNPIKIKNCTQRLRSFGARTSYYVPTDLLVPCANSHDHEIEVCRQLKDNVQSVLNAGVFSDLSFDFTGYPAMRKIPRANALFWNTWAIKPTDFHKFPKKDFRFVIMDTSSDPNGY